jgi:hypothetical protein
VSAIQDKPNQGVDLTGDIRQPIWYRTDGIFVRTEHLESGRYVRGVSDVSLDAEGRYDGVLTFEFPHLIRDFDYSPTEHEFVVTFSRSANHVETVRASPVGLALAVVDTVLGTAWLPRAARYLGSTGNVLCYATSPDSLISGFYVSGASVAPDSLVVRVDLSIGEARGCDVGEALICLGETVAGPTRTEVSVIDLRGDLARRTISTLEGSFVSVALNEADRCAIVATEVFYPDPGAKMHLVNLADGSAVSVDVRTQRCACVLADFASWAPDGTAFAFSSGGFTGEGDVSARQLWVRTRINNRK